MDPSQRPWGGDAAGYLHPGYARSLAEFGTPRALPQSGGWILVRRIPDSPYRDAMGCYPLFACQDWSQLYLDVEAIGHDLVSLALVTDPFGVYDAAYLERCFPDVARPFKEHFVVDLKHPLETYVSRHHKRYARKALRSVRVERCADPLHFLEDWLALYDSLIERHDIEGIPAFSKSSFAKQFQIPGLAAYRAIWQQKTVGMILWYLQGPVGYYHLGAYSEEGYDLRASFALFWHAIHAFGGSGELRWLDLGAGSGTRADGKDGLSRFKRGWATGTRTAYFCGRIYDRDRYSQLVLEQQVLSEDYFPAYRVGEFD
jgi:hypothetical protein